MTDADDAALERVRQQAGELFLANHIEKHQAEALRNDEARAAHNALHESDRRALNAALSSEQRRLEEHRVAHDAAHSAHEALHQRAVEAHLDQHRAEARAVDAATAAMDKRLDGMNEFRDQLRDQASSFVRQENFDTFKDERRHALTALEDGMDRRFEELRHLIATEREERRATEGVKRGMNSTTAIIVTAIGVVGTVLGIIIVGANLLTGQPP